MLRLDAAARRVARVERRSSGRASGSTRPLGYPAGDAQSPLGSVADATLVALNRRAGFLAGEHGLLVGRTLRSVAARASFGTARLLVGPTLRFVAARASCGTARLSGGANVALN